MSTTRLLPISLHVHMYAAYRSVTKDGKHLSSAIEDLFRTIQPSAELALTIRQTLFYAIRFGDMKGALQGASLEKGRTPELRLPEWLAVRMQASLGDRFEDYLKACTVDAPVTIRVNTLRTDVGTCVRALADFGPKHVGGTAVQIAHPFGLFKSDAFTKGWFEQQDGTSQRVAESLDVQPGQRVVDSCAGAGGKTLQLAALMRNQGRIIALDVVEEKLQACRKRAARAGADIIETRLITTTKVVKRMAETADRVLIDAPCSGTGVLRRNPDIIWHLTAESLVELLATQAQILRVHSRMLKPGGRMVYATCSVLNEEGPDQVRAFLRDHDGFSLAEEWQTVPGADGGDSFYAAIITRSDAS